MADEKKDEGSILGVSTTELAGLSVEELTGNSSAIKMILHYYKQLVDENRTLRNEVNTLKTYVSAYDTTKSNSATGALLLAISNIPLGFGINLSTTPYAFWAGTTSIAIGAAMIAGGIYFSFFKDRR
jgi:predicted metalloendopeptidase